MNPMKQLLTRESEFRDFLKECPNESLNVVIYAAFGFKNEAEKSAVALLNAYNRKKEVKDGSTQPHPAHH